MAHSARMVLCGAFADGVVRRPKERSRPKHSLPSGISSVPERHFVGGGEVKGSARRSHWKRAYDYASTYYEPATGRHRHDVRCARAAFGKPYDRARPRRAVAGRSRRAFRWCSAWRLSSVAGQLVSQFSCRTSRLPQCFFRCRFAAPNGACALLLPACVVGLRPLPSNLTLPARFASRWPARRLNDGIVTGTCAGRGGCDSAAERRSSTG
jgi:hypothetical protein